VTDIRLVGIDIDGTLVNSQGTVTDATHAELARLHKKGVVIAIITGRRFESAIPIVRQLDVPVLMGLHNGASLRRPDGETLYAELLPEEDARRAAALARERGAYPIAYQPDPTVGTRILCEPPETAPKELVRYLTRYASQNAEYVIAVENLNRCLVGGVLELMAMSPISSGERVIAHMRDGLASRGSVITAIVGTTAYVEVAHPRVSKALPLRFLCEREGWSAENVLAVGDNYNDLDMLRYAGHPVIMGNAAAELRAMGFCVAPPNDEDGLAQALSVVR
jgi:hypothetical protein